MARPYPRKLAVLAATGTMLIVAAQDVAAEIFRYVNKDGIVCYTNKPQRRRMQTFSAAKLSYSPRAEIPLLDPEMRRTVVEKVKHTARRLGVDPNLAKAVAKNESDFNPRARSHKGAVGVMQLIPETGARYGVQDLYDADSNISGGLRYLRDLLSEFQDVGLAVAAYNAGENAVRKHNGIPPYQETQTYVQRVLKTYQAYRGFDGLSPLRTVTTADGLLILTNKANPLR
ncbi:MAG: lytic transglycosylase domain-containing protein [Candidatus Schekmanbacteria bacterium]|nr:lytic transglycosylase domain-containing protein [Candidatus Schekmanbacteria bacterium]